MSERMVRRFLDYHQQNFNRKAEGNRTLQKKVSILKGRDRKLECKSSEFDVALLNLLRPEHQNKRTKTGPEPGR